MTQELIYTSVPQGLVPGSRGFCTVAQTSGIPAALQERLEALSGYRHLFEPQDPRAHNNPAAWSHYIFTVSGIRYHALSRVADAGLDYSQRSNKLAHHFALEAAERNSAGPAWCLRQPNFLHTKWEGTPRLLPPGRVLPQGSSLPTTCSAWQRVVGDAGWAGILVESLFTQREAYLLYQPGTNVLDLIAEAIALLPPEKRWDVTFQTYFTRIPAGVECRWKGVIAGSEAETVARRSAGALLIDLTRKQPVPQENAAVTAARLGQTIDSRTAQPPSEPSLDLSPLPVTRPNKPLRTVAQRPGAPDYELSPLGSLADLASSSPELNPPGGWDPRGAQRIERRTGLWVSVAVLAMLLLTGGIAGWLYRSVFFDSMPTVEAGVIASGEPAAKVEKSPTQAEIDQKVNAAALQQEKIAKEKIESIATDYLKLLPKESLITAYKDKHALVKGEIANITRESSLPAEPKEDELEGNIKKYNEDISKLQASKMEIEKILESFKNQLSGLTNQADFEKNLQSFKNNKLAQDIKQVQDFIAQYDVASNLKNELSVDLTLHQSKLTQLKHDRALSILKNLPYLELRPMAIEAKKPAPQFLAKLNPADIGELQLKLENCPEYELTKKESSWELSKMGDEKLGTYKQTHGVIRILNNKMEFSPNSTFKVDVAAQLKCGILCFKANEDQIDIPLQRIKSNLTVDLSAIDVKNIIKNRTFDFEYLRSKDENVEVQPVITYHGMDNALKVISWSAINKEKDYKKYIVKGTLPKEELERLKLEITVKKSEDNSANATTDTEMGMSKIKVEISSISALTWRDGKATEVELNKLSQHLGTYLSDYEIVEGEIATINKSLGDHHKTPDEKNALVADLNVKNSEMIKLNDLWPKKFILEYRVAKERVAKEMAPNLRWQDFLQKSVQEYKDGLKLQLNIYRVIPPKSIKIPFPLIFEVAPAQN